MKLLLFLAAFALSSASTDPWTDQDIVQPKALADRIQAKDRPQPPIYYVGFPTLYRSGSHIAGATLAGPCSKAEGLDALKRAVGELAHDKEIFIYCGCCPFIKCPNIRPAYTALRDMGFSKVKIVMIETNLHTDWIEKGYPSEKAPQ
jgi:thiosulfate/3-mercaptopyruvate sulfurtransferase